MVGFGWRWVQAPAGLSTFTLTYVRGPAAPSLLNNQTGFGNDAIDYLNPLELGEEESFAAALRRRGFDVYVVVRISWLTA